jgi:hypothetical protein
MIFESRRVRECLPFVSRFLIPGQFFFQLRRRIDRAFCLVALHHYFHGVAWLYARALAQNLIHGHHVASSAGHQRRTKGEAVDRPADGNARTRPKHLRHIHRRSDRGHHSRFLSLDPRFELQFPIRHRNPPTAAQ